MVKSRKLLLTKSRPYFWPKVPWNIVNFWPKAGSVSGRKPALLAKSRLLSGPKAGSFGRIRPYGPYYQDTALRALLPRYGPTGLRYRNTREYREHPGIHGIPGNTLVPGIPGNTRNTREYPGIPGIPGIPGSGLSNTTWFSRIRRRRSRIRRASRIRLLRRRIRPSALSVDFVRFRRP